MNWHILLALGLCILTAGTLGWNRMFRGYCLESVAYFRHEVLPQLQNNSAWNDEAADLDDEAIPDTENFITDSTLIIVPLTCAMVINCALLIFLSTDIPISGFINGLVAFGNALWGLDFAAFSALHSPQLPPSCNVRPCQVVFIVSI